jgi:hypothetical protein
VKLSIAIATLFQYRQDRQTHRRAADRPTARIARSRESISDLKAARGRKRAAMRHPAGGGPRAHDDAAPFAAFRQRPAIE